MKKTYRQIELMFIKFLKENDALDKFKKALMHQRYNEFITWENYINPLSICPLKKYLTDADYLPSIFDRSFLWSETKEGHEFWSKIHTKWRILIKNNITNIINEKL